MALVDHIQNLRPETAPPRRRYSLARAATALGILLSVLHLLALAAIAALEAFVAERWWVSAVLLYLPQGLFALPALVTVPLVAVYARRCLWLPAAALLWVVWPMMGFQWSARPQIGAAEGVPVRVMTFNVKMNTAIHRAGQLIQQFGPDIVFLQEAQAPPEDLGSEWHVAGPATGTLIASRWPFTNVEKHNFEPDGPKWRYYLRGEVEIEGRRVVLYDVHLDSPHDAFESFAGSLAEGARALDANNRLRLAEAALLARRIADETGPILVAGDLNAPERSLVFRTMAAHGLTSAFRQAGRGFGYTYGHALRTRFAFIRIDHILISPHWRAASCEIEDERISDHRPQLADLLLLARRGETAPGAGSRPERSQE